MIFDVECVFLVRDLDDVGPLEVMQLLSLAVDLDATETNGHEVESTILILYVCIVTDHEAQMNNMSQCIYSVALSQALQFTGHSLQ